jgi:hypothetical protein
MDTSPVTRLKVALELNPKEDGGIAKLLVALGGIFNVTGAIGIALLTTTDKKLFAVAVYPTLANDLLNNPAFNSMNKVDVVTGYEAYYTATIILFYSVALIH